MVPWWLRDGSVTDPYGSVRATMSLWGYICHAKKDPWYHGGKREHRRISVTSEMQSPILVVNPSDEKSDFAPLRSAAVRASRKLLSMRG